MRENTDNFKVRFIGIGVPKSGTTWISECLTEHPGICFAKNKEPHFFNREGEYAKGMDYYKQNFSHCSGEKIKGEFTVNYIYFDKAAQRIKESFPDVKILICLRNPVERAYSNYRYEKSRCQIPQNLSFEQALARSNHYINYSFYAEGLKRYLNLFPKENVLVLIYEDMKKNPKDFIQKIYKFLGVDENFVPSNLNIKINFANQKAFLSPWLERISRRISAFFFENKRKVKRPWFLKTLKILGLSKLFFILKSKNYAPRKKPVQPEPIKRRTKKYLQETFRTDIRETETIIGRNLNFWKEF